MWLFYMDESGNTGNRLDDPDRPIHYLAALGVHESQINPLEKAFRTIVQAFFGDAVKDKNFEIKGQALRKGGSGFYKGLSPAQRVDSAKQLLGLLKQFNVKAFYFGVEKSSCRNDKPPEPHRIAFLALTTLIHRWLSSPESATYGLLVCDEIKEMQQQLIDDINWDKRNANVLTEHIVDSVHFVRSTNNVLTQLADLCAFVINRGLRVNTGSASSNHLDDELFALLSDSFVDEGVFPKKNQLGSCDSGSVT